MDLVMWVFSFRQIFSDECSDMCSSAYSHVMTVPWTVMTAAARRPPPAPAFPWEEAPEAAAA